ncbi:MFS transporter [Vibrio tapetis]|uniref:Putative inner membrane transport protein n=1 Tax=Vibrio tapetis subsp. tapetis TaxID=1671868 RepID=A0A2N8ZJV3_9VIBR|nr:MFS transporter [Vibrio tapetis]SON52175.1 putative inner membrane transport protein [Vibrio tapetis subsp. tapetis]
MNTIKQHSRLLLGALLVVLSLSLIFVVGYAQALKSYQQQSRDAVIAQTDAARMGIEQILSSGVPLHDIAGLEKVLAPIALSDKAVVDIRMISGQQELYRYTDSEFEGSVISIALHNKFTQVGRLEIVVSDEKVQREISARFVPMIWLVGILVGLFVFMVLRAHNRAIYFTAFGIVFLTMSLSVMLMVGALYKSGLESKANSMASIVTQRLAPVLVWGISPQRISGVDEMLDGFRQTNKEVSSIVVEQQARTIASSQAQQALMSVEGMAEFPISDERGNKVTIAFHPKVLLSQLLKILKNFAILFAGCAFICFAFIRLLSRSENQSHSEVVLAQVKPLLLVTVLMESLMAPVLPQYLTQIALDNGGSAAWSSYFFTLYFVGFAATLLPASRLIEMFDIRRVLSAGVILSSLGCAFLAYDSHLTSVLVARFISGVGQAIIFIAVQGYILRFSDQSNKTQAAGIIVFCFNAGFISGAAIGALLADTLGIQGIFALSALIGGLMLMFGMLLPSMKAVCTGQNSLLDNIKGMMHESATLIRVPAFMRTMLLVGMPTKMMLTGVVSFAVPLLLSDKGVAKESIGQVLMAYAFAVLFISGRVSPLIDRFGSSKWALCLGNAVAALSLGVLGAAFSLVEAEFVVSLATISMLVMGVAHGLINAPVVTHVVKATEGHNANSVAATYRFLERFGHVAGAIVVGQLLASLGHLYAFWAIGVFFIFASVLMLLLDRQKASEVAA